MKRKRWINGRTNVVSCWMTGGGRGGSAASGMAYTYKMGVHLSPTSGVLQNGRHGINVFDVARWAWQWRRKMGDVGARVGA